MTKDASAFAIPSLLVLLIGGCPPQQQRPVGGVPPRLPGAAATQPGQADRSEYRLIVQLRLAAIEVPAGAASESEEIWSYLDEEPIRAARSAVLARNGLRVGLATASVWPDLAGVFKRLSGREVGYTTTATVPGRPTGIPVKRRQPAQTTFVFQADGTLSGADYPPGDSLLVVDCTLGEEDPSSVLLTVLPQVRSSEIQTTIVNRPEGVGFESSQETFSFQPLQFQATVASKDILVIGPSPDARRADSVGGRFLVAEKAGIAYETVLVVMPQVVAVPISEMSGRYARPTG
jgi:hypothetical protein